MHSYDIGDEVTFLGHEGVFTITDIQNEKGDRTYQLTGSVGQTFYPVREGQMELVRIADQYLPDAEPETIEEVPTPTTKATK